MTLFRTSDSVLFFFNEIWGAVMFLDQPAETNEQASSSEQPISASISQPAGEAADTSTAPGTSDADAASSSCEGL